MNEPVTNKPFRSLYMPSPPHKPQLPQEDENRFAAAVAAARKKADEGKQ